MYNSNGGQKHNKRIIIVTLVLVVFSVVTLLTARPAGPMEMLFKDTITNLEYYFIKAPINYVNDLFAEYHDLKDVYKENAKLKKQLENLSREVAMNETLEEEIAALKEMTGIKNLPTDYQLKYANVITRDASTWQNEITIDMGHLSHIEKGMAVINSDGMIGIVSQVNEMSSVVTLLSSENLKVQLPVVIKSDGKNYYGLLNSFDVDKQNYQITLLSDVEKIEKDAKVLTSGLGGKDKSPKGLLIGTVESFGSSHNTTKSVCRVKPSVSFDSLNKVAIIQRKNKK